jgi:hypothetical protein
LKKRPQPEQACCQKSGTAANGLGRLTLKETHSSTQMGGYPSASGRVSVEMKAEIGLKGRSSRERFRRRGHNSASFLNDHGDKFAAIRAKNEANGGSIFVYFFRKKGFCSYYTLKLFVKPFHTGRFLVGRAVHVLP